MITSLHNPLVKELAALHTKKAREESSLFLVEGLQLVGFGVAAGWELAHLLIKADYQAGHKAEAVLADAVNSAAVVHEVAPEVMGKLSQKDNPPSVLGVFKQRLQALKKTTLTAPQTWLLLEEPRDPGNLGTCIRSADALGAAGVLILTPATDLWAPETVRATMGSIFHLPLIRTTRGDFLAWLAAQSNAQLAGLHLQGETPIQHAAALPRPLILAMGTEQSGLSPDLTAACSHRLKIPMAGQAESLNLAQATTLALWEALRPVVIQ
ncbi:MAG: RNA methyltransferase [Alphaproteobacteria bacterium]|nr:RNA methyltransferase [Alphaproteobacteria bacterium]